MDRARSPGSWSDPAWPAGVRGRVADRPSDVWRSDLALVPRSSGSRLRSGARSGAGRPGPPAGRRRLGDRASFPDRSLFEDQSAHPEFELHLPVLASHEVEAFQGHQAVAGRQIVQKCDELSEATGEAEMGVDLDRG